MTKKVKKKRPKTRRTSSPLWGKSYISVRHDISRGAACVRYTGVPVWTVIMILSWAGRMAAQVGKCPSDDEVRREGRGWAKKIFPVLREDDFLQVVFYANHHSEEMEHFQNKLKQYENELGRSMNIGQMVAWAKGAPFEEESNDD